MRAPRSGRTRGQSPPAPHRPARKRPRTAVLEPRGMERRESARVLRAWRRACQPSGRSPGISKMRRLTVTPSTFWVSHHSSTCGSSRHRGCIVNGCAVSAIDRQRHGVHTDTLWGGFGGIGGVDRIGLGASPHAVFGLPCHRVVCSGDKPRRNCHDHDRECHRLQRDPMFVQ